MTNVDPGRPPVRTRTADGVLEVVLDRPKANAIDAATSQSLGEVFAGFRAVSYTHLTLPTKA